MKAYLSISLEKIIVLAPSIPHFKGLGMRNLQYEIRICPKTHRHYLLDALFGIQMKPCCTNLREKFTS